MYSWAVADRGNLKKSLCGYNFSTPCDGFGMLNFSYAEGY